MAFDFVHHAGGVERGAVRDAGSDGGVRGGEAGAGPGLGCVGGAARGRRDRGVLPPGALGADLQRVRAPDERDHAGADRDRRAGGRRGRVSRAHAQVRRRRERAQVAGVAVRRAVGGARGRHGALVHHGREAGVGLGPLDPLRPRQRLRPEQPRRPGNQGGKDNQRPLQFHYSPPPCHVRLRRMYTKLGLFPTFGRRYTSLSAYDSISSTNFARLWTVAS